MNRRVLVTGANGFVGAHVCRRFAASGDSVIGLMRRAPVDGPLHRLGVYSAVTRAFGDVCDTDLMVRLVNEHAVTHIVHLAGQALPQVARRAPAATFQANIAGAWSVLEAARLGSKIAGVVLLSTSKVYSLQSDNSGYYAEEDVADGLMPYGASKRCAEILAESYRISFNFPAVSLRLANTYGPADPHRTRLIPMAVDCALSGARLEVHGDGQQLMDLLYIDDAVDGIELALEHATHVSESAFNLGSGQGVTVEQVVRAVQSAEPRLRDVSFGSIPPHPTEMLDISSFESAVGFRSRTTISAGIQKTLEADSQWRSSLSSTP